MCKHIFKGKFLCAPSFLVCAHLKTYVRAQLRGNIGVEFNCTAATLGAHHVIYWKENDVDDINNDVIKYIFIKRYCLISYDYQGLVLVSNCKSPFLSPP